MNEIVKEINSIAAKFNHLELSLKNLENDKLTIAASNDFSYYHNFEIIFEELFSIIGNTSWVANDTKLILEILDKSFESQKINLQYKVEIGNVIFRFPSQDDLATLIIAKKIIFKNEFVKYQDG